MRHLVLLTLLMLAVGRANAIDFERVLVPIAITGEAPGAFGSRWVSRLTITNTALQPVTIFGYSPFPSGCGLATCPPVPPTPAGITFFPIVSAGSTSQGAIIQVDRSAANSVWFQLRVQDVSRAADSWGTDIPVVRERALFSSRFELLDVPLLSGFRPTLRLYDIDGHEEAQAILRFYKVNTSVVSPIDILFDPTVGPAQPDQLLREQVVTLTTEHRGGDPASDLGYFEMTDFASLPELVNTGNVRIEVEPVTPGLRLWGFVAITNNATQQITTIVPR